MFAAVKDNSPCIDRVFEKFVRRFVRISAGLACIPDAIAHADAVCQTIAGGYLVAYWNIY